MELERCDESFLLVIFGHGIVAQLAIDEKGVSWGYITI